MSDLSRISIIEKIEDYLLTKNELSIWAPAVTMGLILIWGSTFLSLDFIYAPARDANGQLADAASCFRDGKQIGIWSSPNWSVVYLFLFPLFLILTASLAKSVRQMIDAFVEHGLLQRVDGKPPTKSDVNALLDAELRSTSFIFGLLAAAVAVLTLGGWWTSSGKPLADFALTGQIVDWTTAIIPCRLRDLQTAALVYTALAYLWMGAALFCFLSCLCLGFIYAAFIRKLANTSTDGQRGTANYILYFDKAAFTEHFQSFVRTYFLACTLGLLAAYLMRLQSEYLLASEHNVFSYLASSLYNLRDLVSGSESAVSAELRYQPLEARNATTALAIAVAGVTLVCLSGALWLLFNAFKSAKKLTANALPEDYGVVLNTSEISSLRNAQFVATVLPDWGAMVIVAGCIVVATFFPRWSLLTAIPILLATVMRRSGEPLDQTPPALPMTFGEKLNLEKFVRRHDDFAPLDDFLAGLRRLMYWICTVETPCGGGTGFLVGPNLVLTNYHVIESIENGEASPRSVICRFDFVRSGAVDTTSGRRVSLSTEKWCLMRRPYSDADVKDGKSWQPHELDYALLQLAEPIGSQINPATGQVRGWLSLKGATSIADTKQDDPLIVVQHPMDWKNTQAAIFLPVQCTFGNVVNFVGNGLRVRHNTSTLPGSSGSPCCNGIPKVVAVHHAGDPKNLPNYRGDYNQAIPIKLIIDDLLKAGIELSEHPPEPPCPTAA